MSKSFKRNNSFVSQVVSKITTDKRVRLFVDQYGDPYIAPNGDGTKVYNLDSQEASDWLQGYVMDKFNNSTLLRDEPRNVLDCLRSYAKNRGLGNLNLELRTSSDNEGNIWYDLGSGAVKITPDGWKFIPQPPILFTRNYSQQKQVLPEKGGDIWELFDFINVKDPQDKLLLISFLTASLVPRINKPILAISGPAGSGKSECTKMLKTLMDPTTPASLPPITSTGELDKLALTSSVMAFDNLSSMRDNVANHFCRLATGAGVRIRKLYKTNEYITFEAIRPIIVNGISQIITQSDLLNRAIPIELSPIEKRIVDDELRKNFSAAQPRLLGAMFDLLAKAMSIYPNVTRTNWPRMGSFVRWGYAISEALGNGITGETYMEAYARVEKIQHDEALHANPLSVVLKWFMEDKDIWTGSAGEFLARIDYHKHEAGLPPEISQYTKSSFWPESPRSASVNLRKNLNDYKEFGLIVIPPKNSSDRVFTIINTHLPVHKIINTALDSEFEDNKTYRDLGYRVSDFADVYPYSIKSKYVTELADGDFRLVDDALKGKIIPEESDVLPNPNDTTDKNDPGCRFKSFVIMHEEELPRPKEYVDFISSDAGKSTCPF